MSQGGFLGLLLVGGLVMALACGGGQGATVAPAPQQPVPPAQPAPAAPAPEPQAAASSPLPQAVEPGSSRAAAVKGKAQESKYGGIAVFAVRRDPPAAFDMMVTNLWYDLHQMGGPVWGSGNLVRPCLEDVFKVCPALAESWEVDKGFTQFTFKLRENVFWHDGQRFDAEDAKFWLELVFFGAKGGDKTRRPAWYSAGIGNLDKVEVLPSSRLKITLKERTPLFLELLATPYYTIAHPRHLAQPRIQRGEVNLAPLDVKMMGMGPFKFLKYEKGSLGQVRRFDSYWEKDAQGRQLPYLDGMDFAIMTDPAAMDAAFRVGRLDGGSPGGGFTLTKERHTGYVRDLGDRVWFAKIPAAGGISGEGLGFNVLKPGPWQDVRVRRAIAFWIDKAESIEATAGGAGFGFLRPLLNPDNPFTTPDFMTWPGWNPATRERDRAEAKRLLAEAGYPGGGFQMSYNCLTTKTWRDRCEFLQAQLVGLGISLKLDLMDIAQWTAAGQSLTYDTVQVASGITVPLPESTEVALTKQSISRNSVAKHEDPRIPELYDRLRKTTSLEERVNTWRELERYYLLEQVYIVPLAGTWGVIPYRSHLKGRIVPPEQIMAYMDFATVWLDK